MSLFKNILLINVLVIGFASSAVAAPKWPAKPPVPTPLVQLALFQQHNLTASVLADLSGRDIAQVKQDLMTYYFPKLLQRYGIQHPAFMDAMKTVVAAEVEQALLQGRITSEQAEQLNQRLRQPPHPRDTDCSNKAITNTSEK